MDYKEMNAIGIVRLMLTDGVITVEQAAKYFPELAESEDERIRKGIIQYLEQSQFGEEHYQIDDDIVRNYIAWLEKQGEQKPAVWSEEDKTMVESINTVFDTCVKANIISEDKGVRPLRNWLKERIVPQPQQEWSEEDEKAINDIMWIIEAYRKNGFNESHKQIANNAEKWLKSLRPQSSWKPSDEKMEYLAKAITTLGDEGDCKTALILNDLRFELKKLREEVSYQQKGE